MIQGFKLGEEDFRGPALRQSSVSELKGNNDLLTLTKPEIIRDIGRQYLEAGVDFIETNTFNSNFTSQEDYGLGHLVGELNEAGARLARELCDEFSTADRPRLVAGVLGPANRTATISPDVNDPAFRNITFDELRETYRDATRGLIKGGSDVMMIETVFDTLNCQGGDLRHRGSVRRTGRAPAGLDFRHHHRSVGPHPDRPDAGSLLAFDAPCQSLRHRPELRAGRQGTAPLCRRSGRRLRHAGQRPSQCRPAQRIRRL